MRFITMQQSYIFKGGIFVADWIQIILRAFLFVFLLFFLLKGLGKKRQNQLNIFDYTTAFVMSSLVAITILDTNINVFASIAAVFIWMIIPFTTDLLSAKSKRFRDFLHGKSTVIIQEGKILEDNLKKERLTTDDLLYHLREKNIFKVADVEFAILEPTGTITIMPKAEKAPLTKSDYYPVVPPQVLVHTVIMDGEILLEPLSELGKSPAWLELQLEKMNVTKENVFLGQADGDGQVTVDLYDDKLTVPVPTEKPMLAATLKKAAADLQLFALAVDNPQSKQNYEHYAAKVEQVLTLMETELKA